ncbi:hypothetical protein ACIP1T_17030 [Pseudomonas japonica]|uniref:hypothetical protein n=1 Tax=Pseudomonas japonica TaxID=256466 RepID=UPI003817D9AF
MRKHAKGFSLSFKPLISQLFPCLLLCIPVYAQAGADSCGSMAGNLNIPALQSKQFTRQSLQGYLDSLYIELRKAKASMASGVGYMENYDFSARPEWEKMAGNDLLMLDSGFDNISPRIRLYECHKNAGWPTATDAVVASESSKPSKDPKSAQARTASAGNANGKVYSQLMNTSCLHVGPRTLVQNTHSRIINNCGFTVTVAVCYKKRPGSDSSSCSFAISNGGQPATIKPEGKDPGATGMTLDPTQPYALIACKHEQGKYFYYPQFTGGSSSKPSGRCEASTGGK